MKKRVLSIFFVFAMLLTLIPTMSFAASAADSVKYIERTWNEQDKKIDETEKECTDYLLVDENTKNFENEKWYVVNDDVEIKERIQVNGTANLILCDGVTLTANEGIEVKKDNTLNIYGQSGDSGKLVASGFNGFAAIGVGENEKRGTLIINGGIVTAKSCEDAAAIGGGKFSNDGTIIITGGTVNTLPCEEDMAGGAGIGGGTNGDGGTIIISGGNINAIGSWDGAGIGSGYSGATISDIIINGGNITAKAGFNSAGIGGGAYGSGGNITINGGNVNAIGNENGAGIGGGLERDGGNITITGGKVIATGGKAPGNYGPIGGAGIGGGVRGAGGNVTISGGNVTANGGDNAPGIGYGGDYDSGHGTLNITTDAIIKVDGKEVTKEEYIKNRNNNVNIATAIKYIERTWDGEKIVETKKNCTNYIVVDENTKTFENGKWYVVNDDVEIKERIQLNGTENLILCDGVTLNANEGIEIKKDNTLNIYSQSGDSGKLEASGFNGFAAIGVGENEHRGTLVINGGIVTAKSCENAAAIGGGKFSNDGTIIITGGTVNTLPCEEDMAGGAGIGGGTNGDGGTIIISGGNINAIGSWDGAGIGSGYSGATVSDIIINGGNITAKAGFNSAGIGGGAYGSGGNITINGGNVNAIGNENGAGIGGGLERDGGTVIISGGTVNATGGKAPGNYGPIGGAGIGGGVRGAGGNVTISGGNVTANGGDNAPGIGYGGDYDSGHGTLNITKNAIIKVNGTQVTKEEYIQKRNSNVNINIITPTKYIERTWDGEKIIETEKDCTDYNIVEENTTTFENEKWYVVNDDVEIKERIQVNGTANLILCDGVTLSTDEGIEVKNDNTLNIYSQSDDSGKLVASSLDGFAAIGGGKNENCGTIFISSGTVNAFASNEYMAGGAGIGGGIKGGGGTVIINGGNVTANGSWDGPGIGGGYKGATGGNITINGGTVTANAGYNAAGIGGGAYVGGGNITINGGNVNAIGNENGAGIGGGLERDGGTVIISGGTVNATGGKAPGNYGPIGGAGIGGGVHGAGGNVTISGGNVTAIGGDDAVAIGGGGDYNPGHGTCNVARNMIIKGGEDAEHLSVISKVGSEKYIVIDELESPFVPNFRALANEEGIRLEWDAYPLSCTSRYVIYTKDGENWKRYSSTANCSITYTKAVHGETYTFNIVAIDADKKEISNMYEDGLTFTYPEEVTFNMAASIDDHIRVQWNAYKDAAKYKVYLWDNNTDNWKRITTVSTPAYNYKNVEDGKEYKFNVIPIDSEGKEIGVFTKDGISCTYTENPFPTTFTAKNVDAGIRLDWSKIDGAAKYILYYQDGDKWTKISSTSNLALTFKKAEAGKTYKFSIRAMDANGNIITGYDKNGPEITR